jgi:hypothetical protein
MRGRCCCFRSPSSGLEAEGWTYGKSAKDSKLSQLVNTRRIAFLHNIETLKFCNLFVKISVALSR